MSMEAEGSWVGNSKKEENEKRSYQDFDYRMTAVKQAQERGELTGRKREGRRG